MKRNAIKTIAAAAVLAAAILLSACGSGAPAPAVIPGAGSSGHVTVTPNPNAPGISKPAFTPQPGRQGVVIPQLNRQLQQNPVESVGENSGYENSGYENSGYENSDYENSGYENSGYEGGGYVSGGYDSNDFVVIKPVGPEPYPYVYLPYMPLDSMLAIISVSNYDGIFVEDGSDEPVSGISTALVINLGVSPIEYATVDLDRGDTVLHFELTDLPPGEYLAVQEKYRQPYIYTESYLNASVVSAEVSDFEFSEYQVAVYENDEGGLTVENISDNAISSVRVFYKFYSTEVGGFVGGITYNAVVENLQPGESRAVRPAHYAPGYSQVVMVRTY